MGDVVAYDDVVAATVVAASACVEEVDSAAQLSLSEQADSKVLEGCEVHGCLQGGMVICLLVGSKFSSKREDEMLKKGCW